MVPPGPTLPKTAVAEKTVAATNVLIARVIKKSLRVAPMSLSGWRRRVENCTAWLSQPSVNCCTLARKAWAAMVRPRSRGEGIMKNLLAVIGDGNAGPVLEAA